MVPVPTGFVHVRHVDHGGEADVPAELLAHYEGRGWEQYTPPDPDTAAAEADIDELPDGTIDEILAWVNATPERAAAALDAETGREHPRKTLTDQLERIVAEHAAPTEED